MLIGALLNSTGLQLGAWRHPSVDPVTASSPENYLGMARLAERGRLDFLFIADSLALVYSENPDAFARIAPLNDYEPLTLLGLMAGATQHIGLIASLTTTYNTPFMVARQMSSLDRVSHGRAGWNAVTSFNPQEAPNFGLERHPPLPERYERALEFVGVARALWRSWSPGALLHDAASGAYLDPARVRPIDHQGRHFSVRGPMNFPPSPQGEPLLVQSGSSELGRAFGVQFAEVIFTAQQDLASAQAFYRDVKVRAAAAGRNPADVRVLPGIVPFVAATDGEAGALYEEAQALIHPDVGLSLLSNLLGGVDLRALDVDGPVPDIVLADAPQHGRVAMLLHTARTEGLSIRQLYQRVAGGARGHWTVTGSARHIADLMQSWFEGKAADGFALIPPILPLGLKAVVDHLLPELVRRGLFPAEYGPGTLRERLGLPLPRAPASSLLYSAVFGD